jgi:hypothetical protein
MPLYRLAERQPALHAVSDVPETDIPVLLRFGAYGLMTGSPGAVVLAVTLAS